MSSLESFFNKNDSLIKAISIILATAVTLTAYALTTFSTKVETKELVITSEKMAETQYLGLEKRLDRIENKIDSILNK
jgi:hypothetical protein